MDAWSSSSGDSSEQYPVYLGIWTNWSRGYILGGTLTLKRDQGDLLIAFIAFFIAFVATRFWRTICFALHRTYSKSEAEDAVYHQRQAILRNSAGAEDGLRLLLQLLWSWRQHPRRLRPLPATLIAIFCISTFTIAGGFSSRISTAVGDEVLIKSSNCGYLTSDYWGDNPDYVSFQAEKIENAANYAQQCYRNSSSGILNCGRFITQRIHSKMDKEAPCPFDDSICRNTSANILLDTGLMDSQDDLGLNTPANGRIRARSTLHCAPLVTDGFKTRTITTLGNFTQYKYGSSGSNNYTYEAEDVESQLRRNSKLFKPDNFEL